MLQTNGPLSATLPRDLTSGLVVFLVALPLCLGVALASGAPLFSGVLAGIVGGILVGLLSGSQTSVSGPAAGLAAVVAAQILSLGSFPAFLLAVVLAGLIQIGLGFARAGFLAAFFPTSVIKGLLAAIGVILILKQIPHVLGHDPDPEGDLAFQQLDDETTFSELARTIGDIHPGAAAIGLLSIVVLFVWGKWKPLKNSPVPAPLIVVLLGVGVSLLFRQFGGAWVIGPSHLVQVPVADSLAGFLGFLQLPDFSQWANPAVYIAAATLAVVASLETLLNLEAVDKLDPQQRTSPPSRELLAQGIGNVTAGLIGGLPITSVIIRSSVNINAGGKTKLAAVIHGGFLLVSVAFLPMWLNAIPLSCLAAILLVTGVKLASPALVKRMWDEGRYQFIPFAATVVAIVLTDLLIGVLIGLAIGIGFILNSNMRRPIRRFVEKHLGGDVLHIELANQVSFLNRAALSNVLDEVPRGGDVLLDAQNTDYIDPDVLGLIRDFKQQTGPARGVEVSLLGFRSTYELDDQTQYVDYSTRELQAAVTPKQVLQILKDGHERFRTGRRLTRDLGRQVLATAGGQHPLAVVLSCIDSRTPAELIFDLGLGDIFSVRIAGNVTSRKVLASAEYGCVVAGAKLILVIGHTRCGAVTAAVNLIGDVRTPAEATGCQHLDHIVSDIQQSTDPVACRGAKELPAAEKQSFVDAVARRNVLRVVQRMRNQSQTLDGLVREEGIAIVGAMYDVVTGDIEFLVEDGMYHAIPPKSV
ncbi:MAG: SulP family inorganic anion transporter [Nitrospirota bacterium]